MKQWSETVFLTKVVATQQNEVLVSANQTALLRLRTPLPAP
jgi:hypothetical protein